MRRYPIFALAAALSIGAAACDGAPEEGHAATPAVDSLGEPLVLRDTLITAGIEAAGTARPFAEVTISTRLMGAVTQVAVREGDRVAAGAVLARVDARDLDARRAQVEAQLAEARAVESDARTSADRFRRLYAESVATRAQLDAVETGLARAQAAVRMAEAAGAEVAAAAGYAELRAPFAGMVTRRFVDAGALAAPGAPLVTVEDGTRLRVVVNAAPGAVGGLRRGQVLDGAIEDTPVRATIEGIVPAAGGTTYTVNAIVENPSGAFLPHSAATLLLPRETRAAIVVPANALLRDGDLAAVRMPSAAGAQRRWIRLGRPVGAGYEVVSGLTAGDTILRPRTDR